MSKPFIHSKSHAKKFGGIPENYISINQFMDSSKATIADSRHRIFFHSSFGIFVVEKLFGQNYGELNKLAQKHNLTQEAINDIVSYTNFVRTNECNTILNENKKEVSVREIAEQHVLEDFHGRFIPTPQDYFEYMDYQDWFDGRGFPSSYKKLDEHQRKKHGLQKTELLKEIEKIPD